MKKIVILILSLILIVSLTGCAASSPPSSAAQPDTGQSSVAQTTTQPVTTTQPPVTTTTAPITTKPEPIVFDQSGAGDTVIQDISIHSNYNVITLTHSGSHNFIVKGHREDGSYELLVNTIGPYQGTVLLKNAESFMLEIKADGNWSVHDETVVGDPNATSFSGTGDFVTSVMVPGTKIFQFTHDGSHNFIVKQHSDTRTDLLVNEIGPYDGEVVSRISGSDACLFEVIADGNWSIVPVL